ncbi:MAG: glycoside hydrolase family 108 protein [Bacteroidia bacterium]
MNIEKAFNILQQFEGGPKVTNIEGDKGGLTKYGISKAAHPELDIANLTEANAIEVYNKDYWQAANCDKIKPELQYLHFDTAVNMGIGSAVKILQAAAGISVDGAFGPATLAASNKVIAADYLLCRLIHYNTIISNDNSQYKFCKGWTNRIASLFLRLQKGEL